MGVIGIITCEILELEFANLLANDPNISQITIIEDSRSARMIDYLENTELTNLQRVPHIKSFLPTPSKNPEVLILVMDLALHRNRKKLQYSLSRAAQEMNRFVDLFVLGYGLCGNYLQNVHELLNVDKPIHVPMDEDHPVDDCVGLLIGGRKCYYSEQCNVPGTFFMTSGWAYHWKRIFDHDVIKAKRMFSKYERTLLILTSLITEEVMRENTNDFSRMLGLRTETRQGTMNILSETIKKAKKYLHDVSDI